jgi:CIC family chloride channel protein
VAWVRVWRLHAIRAALAIAPTEAQRLLALTVIVGALCGLAAVAFHLSIRACERWLIDEATDTSRASWALLTVLTPAIGAAVAGVVLARLAPNARGSGIPLVKATFATEGTRLRARDALAKFVLASVQIGSGSSLGREGPTVQICATLASSLGRLARVSRRSVRRLLPVGAAAGVAAAFNAPIAAVTFTIEEIVGGLDRSVLSGAIVAAAAAAVIERSILGEDPIFRVPQGYGLHHASSLMVYAALGVAAGLVSVAFTESLLATRAWFGRLRRAPSWAKPAVGGLATGLLAAAALAWLGARGVTGGGYETLSVALSGGLALRVMLVLGAFKVAATVLSYGSGGAGGIFAPSLFIGGMLGGSFGWLDAALLGHDGRSVGAFALVGMGAAFAGIVRAPMTSVLIIVEMTNGYSLILPLMIANMTSYGLARRLRPAPIYEALLAQDGVHLRDAAVRDALESIPVEAVYAPGAPFVSFSPTTRALELMRAPRAQQVFPVLADDRRLVGLVTVDDLALLDDDLALVVNAADLMRTASLPRLGDDVHVALRAMIDHGVGRLPVVDAEDQVVGFIDEGAVARAYLRGGARHQAPS